MDPTTPLHQDALHGERDIAETPHAQEPHKPFSRTQLNRILKVMLQWETNPSVGHQPKMLTNALTHLLTTSS